MKTIRPNVVTEYTLHIPYQLVWTEPTTLSW